MYGHAFLILHQSLVETLPSLWLPLLELAKVVNSIGESLHTQLVHVYLDGFLQEIKSAIELDLHLVLHLWVL